MADGKLKVNPYIVWVYEEGFMGHGGSWFQESFATREEALKRFEEYVHTSGFSTVALTQSIVVSIKHG